MSRVVKPPITHTKFFKYKADQVDAATHLKRFSFTLDETFAAVQLSSYHSSGNVVLKTAYDKIMTKLEADPKLPLSTTLINQVTDKCFKRATSLSRAADLDDPHECTTKTTSDLQGCYLGGLLTWRAHALEGSLGAYISDLSFPATRRICRHISAYLLHCCVFHMRFSLYRYLYMILPILIYK